MNKKKLAKTKGISLILMTIIVEYSIVYPYLQFDNPDQFEFLKENIINNLEIYYSILLGVSIIVILDFLDSFA